MNDQATTSPGDFQTYVSMCACFRWNAYICGMLFTQLKKAKTCFNKCSIPSICVLIIHKWMSYDAEKEKTPTRIKMHSGRRNGIFIG